MRRLILLLLLFFVCDKLFAATFTVTSNADSGPGTLRQALLDAAANGTATTDYIYFNLPGATQASVTITVQTQLPYVTANVIIDGTTQPGAALGVSNAKVIITPATPAPNLNAFVISPQVTANDAVEFYGLYIVGFGPNNTDGSAFYSTVNCKLVIGTPGKGNVICGNYCGLLTTFQNARIQSNFWGIEPDGATPNTNLYVLSSNIYFDGLIFGGPIPADGNVVLCGNNAGLVLGYQPSNQAAKTATIQNNFFGTDYKATTAINTSTQPFIQVEDPLTTLNITNNVFSASEPAIAAFMSSTIIVKGNFFGTDNTRTYSLGSGAAAIEENGGVNATIGGTTPADQNIFTGYFNPIAASNSTTDVIQNEFYCNANVQLNDPSGTNFVTITSLLANSVAGDAPPGATVQLYFYKTQCGTCNPNFCFATVTADANGKWRYNGAITLNVMASSTVANNTYGFQPFVMNQKEVTITNFDCHHPGSIELKEARQGNFQFLWQDSQGNTVGTTQKIRNLQPGTYTLQISETGSCPSETGQFTVIDLTPKVFPQTAQLDCSNPTANFTTYPSTGPGITVAKYYWEDASGNVISTKQTVNNLTAGNYSLYITDSNGCNSAKVLIQVLPAPVAPTINGGSVTNATCGLANGSITGITLTNGANTSYGWNDINNKQVSAGQLNLANVPAGQYYFFVYYDFNCPPVKSAVFTINDDGVIALDDSGVKTTSSTCSNSNGSISGITTTGATAYQWFNSQNQIVGSTIDLSNVPAGTYYLVASNNTCTKQSQVYAVSNIPAASNFPSTFTNTSSTCNLANGGLVVTFTPDNAPVSYRWADAGGKTLLINAPLTNVAAGSYQLYVTDSNGCESLYKTYTINATPVIQINPGSAQITPDQCLLSTGSIQNTAVMGGVPPYIYSWQNSSGQIVGTSLNLTNVVAGTYTLQVKDSTACGLATQALTVPEQSEFVTAPVLDNLQICTPGQAMLMVKNPQPGYSYRLYGSATGADTLAQNTTGIFTINVINSNPFYVTQYTGACESSRVAANISIGLSGLTIPNTFTPNNDGINDYWNIKGIENYPGVLIQIFSRYGQKVFESRGYSQPFDGRSNGTLLPSGVYYYIINLNANCSLAAGSLALIR
ncbi:MAG TPA: gliding motility-associated C-terminal domain-containing protein [Mucilaginibacter sp.]|jgi:gliding motility-associated-like protein|nr:gliding motility-associated C-terminal domain-containing protein [Mucilaginibacter sp.]